MHREFIQKLTNLVEANLANETFGPKEMAREAGMSHSSLIRKLKTISNQNASQFIREVRLKKAKELLQDEDLTAAEISYRVGFGSPTYFNKCFHEYFGYSPGELKNHEPGNEPVTLPVEIIPKKPKRTKMLIGLVISLIIIVPAAFFIIQKVSNSKEKSIAVIPFINDSHDSTNIYFINGVTETITDKLAQINDLKVTSRNSAERYRNNKTKSTPRIAHELGVRYILEGSGQKIGDSVLVSVQLIDARKDKHIISHQYAGKYEDIFNLYSEIALDVVSKVQAKITPEEKKLIEKPSSEKLDVMRMLIQGNEMLNNSKIYFNQRDEYLRQAEAFYRKAIQIDSINSQAWVQLGDVYMNRGNYDTANLLAQKALLIDPENSDAYLLKGLTYCLLHRAEEMKRSLNLAIKYNPENYWAIHWLGGLYYYRGDFLKAIDCLLQTKEMLGDFNSKSSSLELRRMELNTLRLYRSLAALGFYEEGKVFETQWLEVSGEDFRGSIYNQLWANIINRKFEQAYQLGLQYRENASVIPNYHEFLCIDFMIMKNYTEAENICIAKKELDKSNGVKSSPVSNYLLGFALMKTGKKVEAEKYFKSAIHYCDTLLINHPELSLPDHYYVTTDRYWVFPYFILTCTYSALGNKGKALESMRLLRKNYRAFDLQVVTLLKYFPMLDNIRNEPEFRDYLKEAETHYLEEHKKVEELLREEGIIR